MEGGGAGAMPDRAWQEEELRASALLFPKIRLRLPPLATSDMLAEREAALAALGDCGAFFVPKLHDSSARACQLHQQFFSCQLASESVAAGA